MSNLTQVLNKIDSEAKSMLSSETFKPLERLTWVYRKSFDPAKFARYLTVFLFASRDLYQIKNHFVERKLIHDEIKYINENSVLDPIFVREIDEYLEVRAKELEAIEILNKSGIAFMAIEEGTLNPFKALSNQYKTRAEAIKTYYTHSKGPKVDLLMASFAVELIKRYSKSLKKSSAKFEIPLIFEGCFISTKRKSRTSKASALKLAVISLNLAGYSVNERQLINAIKMYEDLPSDFRNENYLSAFRDFARFRSFEI